MTVEITLMLPESLPEHATHFGQAIQSDTESVLADTLEMMWSVSDTLPGREFLSPVSELSDKEVLALADSKMDAVQNRRLGELQTRGKMVGLNHNEQYELSALIHLYRIGQLRKSQGLAEAVRRDLRNPSPV